MLPSPDIALAKLTDDLCRRVIIQSVAASPAAHVFGFSAERQRETEWVGRIRHHLRFRWLSTDLMDMLPRQFDEFVETVQRQVHFEVLWRDSVQPSSVRSSLLLPECAFETSGACRLVWKEAGDVDPGPVAGEEEARILRVTRLLRSFRTGYWQRDRWEDDIGRQFRIPIASAMHGRIRDTVAEEERWWKWKYSWLVPDGFYYDVTYVPRQPFYVYDVVGRQLRTGAGEHINLDCHGRETH